MTEQPWLSSLADICPSSARATVARRRRPGPRPGRSQLGLSRPRDEPSP